MNIRDWVAMHPMMGRNFLGWVDAQPDLTIDNLLDSLAAHPMCGQWLAGMAILLGGEADAALTRAAVEGGRARASSPEEARLAKAYQMNDSDPKKAESIADALDARGRAELVRGAEVMVRVVGPAVVSALRAHGVR